MGIKRSSVISLRIENELLDKLEKTTQLPEKKFNSVSEAIRNYTELGMLTESYQHEIKNPEFIKSVEELKQGDKVFEWLQTLNDTQLDAIFMASKMEKEGRYVQATFR